MGVSHKTHWLNKEMKLFFQEFKIYPVLHDSLAQAPTSICQQRKLDWPWSASTESRRPLLSSCSTPEKSSPPLWGTRASDWPPLLAESAASQLRLLCIWYWTADCSISCCLTPRLSGRKRKTNKQDAMRVWQILVTRICSHTRFFVFQAKITPWIPNVIFGVMAILGAGLGLLLPETANRPLPQTIEDIENWKRLGKQRTAKGTDQQPAHLMVDISKE